MFFKTFILKFTNKQEADDSRFNLINTCNDLSLEILKYGNTSEHVRKGMFMILETINKFDCKKIIWNMNSTLEV